MKQQTEGEDYKSLKLYNLSNLKASVFYQIMSSQKLELLIVETDSPILILSLSQELMVLIRKLWIWIKKSLQRSKISPDQNLNEKLSQSWIDIQEQYYKLTDEGKFKSFLSERIFEDSQDREMMIIDCCSLIIDFENKYGVKIADYTEALNKIGISGSFEQIVSQIKQKRMKYRFLKANKEKQNNETAKNDFYDLWSIAVKNYGYFPSTVLLIEWCGILNTLKRMSDGRGNKKD